MLLFIIPYNENKFRDLTNYELYIYIYIYIYIYHVLTLRLTPIFRVIPEYGDIMCIYNCSDTTVYT